MIILLFDLEVFLVQNFFFVFYTQSYIDSVFSLTAR